MRRVSAAMLAAMTICAGHPAFAQAPPAAPAPQGRGSASPAATVISPEIWRNYLNEFVPQLFQ
jgi:hypothetical protein